MKNKQAVERFDQAHGAKIDKLFWIAGSLDCDDLKELLEYMEDKEFEKLFPDIAQWEFFNECKENEGIVSALCEFEKFGLLAEVHVPKADNFSYKNGKPVSWSVHDGVCRIGYVYAETLEALMIEVEKVATDIFQEYLRKDKLTTPTPSTP